MLGADSSFGLKVVSGKRIECNTVRDFSVKQKLVVFHAKCNACRYGILRRYKPSIYFFYCETTAAYSHIFHIFHSTARQNLQEICFYVCDH